ncbi:hypothetical protein [Iodobacter ciconiae]|uniref:Uncharacterized protein n=1 Tax=Iodobacter ciconiae TaxID=2496266 RepID=A0A3S8ZNM6_9NEIS|nr:hypothetical protein [Iodobacter ciconiae]AZN35138.1 hypothetical protein EJO50_00735 [Iodobacter ciconiae]
MGKQVNFYLTPSDFLGVKTLIDTIEPCFILHSRSKSNEPLIVDDFAVRDGEDDWLFYYLVRQCDILDVKMRAVPSQGYWVIDETHSPVIELNKCFFNENTLGRGRIYFNEKYYNDNSVLIQKPDAFKIWANAILRHVRKKLIRKDDFYWGEEASLLSNASRCKIR